MRRAMRSVSVRRVTDVEVADVKMRETSEQRKKAQDETDAKADEIKGVHYLVLRLAAGFLAGWVLAAGSGAAASGRRTWKRRSRSNGVSMMASIKRKQRRVSL